MTSSLADLLEANSGIRLDVGCGANKQDGFVGMDARDLPGVDIVHNWNVYPWPLPDESVLVAVASHVVEHVNPADGGFLRWMDELWRVMKVGGEVAIATPHGLSQGFRQDPTHCNPMDEATFAYFDPENESGLWNIYRPRPWSVKHLFWNPMGNIEAVLVKRGENGHAG
jgi:hypothetical protein